MTKQMRTLIAVGSAALTWWVVDSQVGVVSEALDRFCQPASRGNRIANALEILRYSSLLSAAALGICVFHLSTRGGSER